MAGAKVARRATQRSARSPTAPPTGRISTQQADVPLALAYVPVIAATELAAEGLA
jgi:hypothetical protein